MDPKTQDSNDALADDHGDDLTDEQIAQVSGGMAKIGVGITIG